MSPTDAGPTQEDLIAENAALRRRLGEIEATLHALRCAEEETPALCAWRTLVEHSRDGALILDGDGVIRYANRRAAELLGLSPDAKVGMAIQCRLAPDARAAVDALLASATDHPSRLELSLGMGAGSETPIELTIFRPASQPAPAMLCAIVTGLSERKRAEQVIDDQLAEIVFHNDNAPVALASLDTDLRFLRINPLMAEFNGLPVTEHIGRTVAEVVPDVAAQARQLADTIVATGKAITEIEVSGETPAQPGVKRFWLEGWYPIRRNREGIVGFNVIAQEVTEQKHAEEALRQSESLLRQVADNLPAFVAYVSAPDLRYQFVNRQYAISFLREREQIIGMPVRDLLGEVNFTFAWPFIQRALAGEACFYENTFNLAEGQRWMHVNFVPTLATDGTAQGIVILSRDITERKEAEAKLAASQSLYRLLAENSSDAVSMIDADGRVVYVSPAYTRRLGYDERDLLELDTPAILQRVHPDDRARIAAEIKRGRELQLPISRYAYRAITKSGDYIWLEDILRRDFDEQGEFVRTIINSRDITERVRAEEERDRLQAHLAQAQKMELVGRLAGGVAHEFNNMLAVIMLRTEMLLQATDPETKAHRSLSDIHAVAKRSAALVRSLLGYARKQIVSPKVLDLNVPIANALPVVRKLLGEEIELVWNPGASLWPVRIDPSQFEQVLVNLCVNARDAIDGTGTISIETADVLLTQGVDVNGLPFPAGDYVMLAVSDTGCGMDDAVLAHIFEPFFTTKEVGSGTGLGLAAVDGIVQQNRGHIQVRSKPGVGTTFKIYLPRLIEGADSNEARPLPSLRRGRGETILLVEDEPIVLEMAAEILRYLGYAVIEAATPQDALQRIKGAAHPVDLLMTDIILPMMNGRELATQIAAIYPNIKWLFVSGYPADMVAQRGVLESGVHFLHKPFSLHELATKVSQALGNAGSDATSPD